jgi:hypothetical protein
MFVLRYKWQRKKWRFSHRAARLLRIRLLAAQARCVGHGVAVDLQENASLSFLSFPYVCPEPVLVK